MDSTAVKTIGIFLFDDVEELDAVGPWEVLAFWTRTWPDDGWRVVTFSLDGAPVTAAKGMRIIPELRVDEIGPMDVVLHPGGLGRTAGGDRALHRAGSDRCSSAGTRPAGARGRAVRARRPGRLHRRLSG